MVSILLAILQFVTIAAIAGYEYKIKSLSLFLWGTLLLMFGMPHLLVTLLGNSGYSDSIMVKASLFVIMFNVVYFITRVIVVQFIPTSGCLRGMSCQDAESRFTHKRSIRARVIYFLLLGLCFLVLIYYSYKYLGGLYNASWGAFRRLSLELGFKSLLRYATMVFFGVAGVSLVFFWSDNTIMGSMGLIIIVSYALLTGNRITILPAMVSVVLLYLFKRATKVSITKIAGLGLLALFALFTVYFLRLLRIHGGFGAMFANYSVMELITQTLDMLLNGDGELGLRKAFYHFIQYDNNFANFNQGHTYIRLLLIAIPSFIAKDIKPPDFAISMGTAWSMNPYNTSYSMHPTLYGDCFANLWWFGIILGHFWALFVSIVDRGISKRTTIAREMLMVLLGTAYVIVGRGSVYNGLFYAFAGTLVILIVDKVSGIKLKWE